MALHANLPEGGSLLVLDLHASSDTLDVQAVTSTAMTLSSAAGGGTTLSNMFNTYCITSFLKTRQFLVIVVITALVGLYAINIHYRKIASQERVTQIASEERIQHRKMESEERIAQIGREMKDNELASKERIAQMQNETELEKTRMEHNYHLLSAQLDRNPQLDPTAALQLPATSALAIGQH